MLFNDGTELPTPAQAHAGTIAAAALVTEFISSGELNGYHADLILSDLIPDPKNTTEQQLLALLAGLLGLTTAIVSNLAEDPVAFMRKLTLELVADELDEQ